MVPEMDFMSHCSGSRALRYVVPEINFMAQSLRSRALRYMVPEIWFEVEDNGHAN